MSKRKSLYTGILNEPMELHTARQSFLGGDPGAAEKAEHVAKNLEQFWARIEALFKHYGVDMSDPMTLALELAKNHVLGFSYAERSKRGRGRPGKWTVGFKGLELYADVKWLATQGHSDLNACRILAENPKYKERYGGESKETLHRRYLEALKTAEPAVQRVIKVLKEELEPPDFDKVCISALALREK